MSYTTLPLVCIMPSTLNKPMREWLFFSHVTQAKAHATALHLSDERVCALFLRYPPMSSMQRAL